MRDGVCLELLDVGKRYGGRTVLDGVSLRVRSGECVCVTGENGCGKSTLLRIAAGLTLPGAGSVLRERDCSMQYVPDQFPPIAMTGRQFLQYMARVDNISDEQLVRRFHMDAYLDQPISGYSKGMRSKIGALQALGARCGLLLLDEPVSGQDAQARAVFLSVVRDMMARGCAVLMACHERALIDALSTRVMRLANGKLLPGDWTRTYQNDACLCETCALYRNGACAGRKDCHA